jgi:D-3-phosphoglycerate dehydrogenase
MLLMMNNDQPGVIGAVGTILGRRGINIASFALGRTTGGTAVGVVNVDDPNGSGVSKEVVGEIQAAPGVNTVWVARV